MNATNGREISGDWEEELRKELEEKFPGISEQVLKKHIAFTDLLDTYNGETIFGIPDFLEGKGFDYEAIKLVVDGHFMMPQEMKAKVTKGELYLGQKIFYTVGKDGETEYDKYFIVARKKRGPLGKITEGVKDMLEKLIPGRQGQTTTS